MRQSDANTLTTSSTVFSKFQITFQFNFVLKGLKAKIFTICIMMSNKVVTASAISFVHTRVSTVESPLHRENVTFRSFLLHDNRWLDEKVKSGWLHYNNIMHKCIRYFYGYHLSFYLLRFSRVKNTCNNVWKRFFINLWSPCIVFGALCSRCDLGTKVIDLPTRKAMLSRANRCNRLHSCKTKNLFGLLFVWQGSDYYFNVKITIKAIGQKSTKSNEKNHIYQEVSPNVFCYFLPALIDISYEHRVQ